MERTGIEGQDRRGERFRRRLVTGLVWTLAGAGLGALITLLAYILFMAAWRASESRPRTYALALGDLDGDGDLDIFAGWYPDGYAIWWNRGDGNFSR